MEKNIILEGEKPWALSSEEIFKIFETSAKGLTEEEAEKRLKIYGTNTFHSKEHGKKLFLFLKQFLSPLIFLLLAASFVTFLLEEWINTSIILLSVLINVILGFYHEYHAENTLDKLKGYIKDRAKVIRNGREEEIDSSFLVPGDLVKLSYGSRVPADIRIIESNNFSADESILTGESMPVEKFTESLPVSSLVAERKNMAHSGTLSVQGYALGIVSSTGNSTEIGKIAGIVSKIDRSATPLKKGVDRLAWFIFYLALLIVLGIFFLGISRGEPFLPMLVLSTAIAVGAVPEALPITLTMILAIGATRIASKKGIVRKLTAAETLGSTTLIMTDKTGTLTLADMQLVGVHTTEALLKNALPTEDQKNFSQEQKNLLSLALHNLDVSVENKNDEKQKWIFKGRPFEVNIAKSCLLHSVSLDNIFSLSSDLILPFNSTNKFSVAKNGKNYTVMGAPDILLKRSSLSKEEYLKIESWIESVSSTGKRLIAIALLKHEENKNFSSKITAENILDLEFKGIFVFYDPIRKEVPDTIRNIHAHGIKIVLVTGDLKGTALSLAKSLGWNVSSGEVLSGFDLQGMSDNELLKILPKIKIFARVTPEDKLRIGLLYQKLGEVVAMTGDGVNDAPALKAMNIGISLGSGSDVAKSASDLVLLDDNFHTISMAIDEGRKILSNIRKAIVYLLSNAMDEMFIVGGSLLFGLSIPITALQIIWVNLFTGSLPALAFAFDENIDKEKYKGKDLKLIFSKEVKILCFGMGIFSSVLLFAFYYLLVKLGLPDGIARSIFFVCFSSYILVIAFSFRSLHRPIFSYNPFSNKKLNWSIALATTILVFTMMSSFMRGIFEIAPLPLYSVPFIGAWIVVNVILIEGAKYFLRKKVF